MENKKDERITADAELFIKANRKALIEKFASLEIYHPDDNQVSLFMAGSPGAGKTEVSKRLVEKFSNKPVRIDADEIRDIFPNYNGTNSHLFQPACTIGVNKLYDYVLAKQLNVILDGTFAYGGALMNVHRSIKRGRKVEIYYIYQDPKAAWELTRKREALEHRKVSNEVFVKGFLLSRENVNKAKCEFKERVELNLIIKNYNTGLEYFVLNIDSVDSHLGRIYTKKELEEIAK